MADVQAAYREHIFWRSLPFKGLALLAVMLAVLWVIDRSLGLQVFSVVAELSAAFGVIFLIVVGGIHRSKFLQYRKLLGDSEKEAEQLWEKDYEPH